MSNETISKVTDAENSAENKINQARLRADEIIKNAIVKADDILNQGAKDAEVLRQSRIRESLSRGNELKSSMEKAADVEKARLRQIAKERQADLILKITDSLI